MRRAQLKISALFVILATYTNLEVVHAGQNARALATHDVNRHHKVSSTQSVSHTRQSSNALQTSRVSASPVLVRTEKAHSNTSSAPLQVPKTWDVSALKKLIDRASIQGVHIKLNEFGVLEFVDFEKIVKEFPSFKNVDFESIRSVVYAPHSATPDKAPSYEKSRDGLTLYVGYDEANALLRRETSVQNRVAMKLYDDHMEKGTHATLTVLRAIEEKTTRINKLLERKLLSPSTRLLNKTQKRNQERVSLAASLVKNLKAYFESMGLLVVERSPTQIELRDLGTPRNLGHARTFDLETQKKRKKLSETISRMRHIHAGEDFHLIFDALRFGSLKYSSIAGESLGRQDIHLSFSTIVDLAHGRTNITFHELRHMAQTRKELNPLNIRIGSSFPMEISKITDIYDFLWHVDEINSFAKSGDADDLTRAIHFRANLKALTKLLNDGRSLDYTRRGKFVRALMHVQRDELPGAKQDGETVTIDVPIPRSNTKQWYKEHRKDMFKYVQNMVNDAIDITGLIIERQHRRNGDDTKNPAILFQ